MARRELQSGLVRGAIPYGAAGGCSTLRFPPDLYVVPQPFESQPSAFSGKTPGDVRYCVALPLWRHATPD